MTTEPIPADENLAVECEHGGRAVDCGQCAAERLEEINEKYDEHAPWWAQ